MKQELTHHILPLFVLFLIISAVWFFNQVPYSEIIFLFLGFSVGTYLLDIDHFIFWFFLRPNLEESRIAQAALKNKDFKSILTLFKATHKNHTNLIFHHYFFQVVLALFTFFVFTSSPNIFVKALLLALNLHLLVDELGDYVTDKKTLQKWLFAREPKQLSADSLKYYLIVFILLLFTFAVLLLKSKP